MDSSGHCTGSHSTLVTLPVCLRFELFDSLDCSFPSTVPQFHLVARPLFLVVCSISLPSPLATSCSCKRVVSSNNSVTLFSTHGELSVIRILPRRLRLGKFILFSLSASRTLSLVPDTVRFLPSFLSSFPSLLSSSSHFSPLFSDFHGLPFSSFPSFLGFTSSSSPRPPPFRPSSRSRIPARVSAIKVPRGLPSPLSLPPFRSASSLPFPSIAIARSSRSPALTLALPLPLALVPPSLPLFWPVSFFFAFFFVLLCVGTCGIY